MSSQFLKKHKTRNWTYAMPGTKKKGLAQSLTLGCSMEAASGFEPSPMHAHQGSTGGPQLKSNFCRTIPLAVYCSAASVGRSPLTPLNHQAMQMVLMANCTLKSIAGSSTEVAQMRFSFKMKARHYLNDKGFLCHET